MKFYDIDSVFTFGKYEGMTIAEVYEKDPKYLKYCEENTDWLSYYGLAQFNYF